MTEVVTPVSLTRELLAWVDARPRTYDDVVDAWVSNCPRHPVWDDAVTEGLVAVGNGTVRLTLHGRAALEGRAA